MIMSLDPEWLEANDIDPIGVGSATLYLGSRVDQTGLTIRPLGWLIEVTRITYILNDVHGTGKRGPTKERFVVPCKVMPTIQEPQVN